LLGVARSICERTTSVFEMIPTRLSASSTTGSRWIPDRRMTRAASVTFISGCATMRSVDITVNTGASSSARRRSPAETNPSTVRPCVTGNPLWPSLSAIRFATVTTVSSGVTVSTSRVIYSPTVGFPLIIPRWSRHNKKGMEAS